MFFTLTRSCIAFCILILSSNLFFSISRAEVVPSNTVRINEFLPNPIGDDGELEFIEIINTSEESVNVSGWIVDTGGSARFTIDSGTSISGNSFLTFFSAQKNISLTNTGDHIQLISPDTVIQDDVTYAASKEGYSYIRTGEGTYEETHTPTPDASNISSVVATPTVAVVPTPTPISTQTPVASPAIYSSDIHVSEFLPNPIGDDGELEFIELHNTSPAIVDISGWVIDTGTTSMFPIPSTTTVGAGEFLAFFSSTHDISLSNSSDHVRFIRPDNIVQDDISYTTSKEGYSYNRLADGTYEQSFTPTPNAANTITTAPASTSHTTTSNQTKPKQVKEETEHVAYDYSALLVINEVLPNPKGSDETGEYIEIKSLDAKSVNLFGWTLDDGAKGSGYHFPKSAVIGSKKIVAFYRDTTKIALNNDTDTVELIDPDGKVISEITYTKPVPEAQSFSRSDSGSFEWSSTVTPHKENILGVQETSAPDSKTIPPKKSVSVKNARVPTVLAAHTELLAWPDIVSSSVPVSQKTSSAYNNKQYAFIFFGAAAAVLQLVSGIFRGESIWRR